MSRVLPILFNTEMVTAILEDRKTVTRRIIKPQPEKDMEYTLGYCAMCGERGIGKFRFGTCEGGGGHALYVRPPVLVGDILWVRETWKCWRANRYEATADIMFKAGGENIRLHFANGNTDSVNRNDYDRFVDKWSSGNWHPSIHMPKEAARIWLRVVNIKAERLQHIPGDVWTKEGIYIDGSLGWTWKNDPQREDHYFSPGAAFEALWNSTVPKNKASVYGWKTNPWVWIIEFEHCEKPGRQQF